ncbi:MULTISPECIES: HU family DNA-binding protein [Fusobacterium]|uniref:HU family DNA-binding protein n=1 Tax=Fusobacterium TaxID=848 RepID=UPI000E54162D|nr:MULTISPECIES: HU family DNA-binding protein [Fusobacterium]MCB8565825.1 HU family DNA-binding protein [Fusobacterium ulcerans]MCB8649917.1 HU family DNA-binding protein [Fusobacterium ulcerans]MDH6459179.1 nucleoid DNA-binding protein [Fusobacterium sp. PH5-7]MEE0137780.1 HU family DNA-binding protein [Fusobacterium ulcerans]RGY64383.1 HU family DNA-binding protein [Fusobacterium ulcerans]
MNKRRFAKVYRDLSNEKIDINQALKEIENFLKTIEEALIADGKIKFIEKGTFEILERKPRIISNPLTRELMTIYPKKSVKFTSSKKLNKKEAD